KALLSGFVVRMGNRQVAAGWGPRLIAYVAGGELKWLDLASTALSNQSVASENNEARLDCDCTDPDGATWRIKEEFRPGSVPGSIQVLIEVSVDQDRAIACLPMLLLFPGVGSFGIEKGQGLFAGLEYLDNEPSSS